MRTALVLFTALAISVPATAQIGTFDYIGGLYSGPNIIPSVLPSPFSEPEPIYITVLGTWKGARFAAPIPDCAGIQVTNVEVLNGYSYSGDIETGIEIDFGTCLPAATDNTSSIIRIDWVPAPGAVNCCPYNIVAHPGFGAIQLIDCDGTVVPASYTPAAYFTIGGYDGDCGRQFTMPLRDPDPADGATGAPLDLLVAAHTNRDLIEDIPIFATYKFYFGTTNNPPQVPNVFGAQYHATNLQPNTTYYWRVEKYALPGNVVSPLWSFTTVGPTTTETTTWGRVKALYR